MDFEFSAGPRDVARLGAPLPRRQGADRDVRAGSVRRRRCRARRIRCGAAWPSSACSACSCPRSTAAQACGMVDAAVVLEELGRAVNPAPFTSSAIGAVSLVLAAGEEREHRVLAARPRRRHDDRHACPLRTGDARTPGRRRRRPRAATATAGASTAPRSTSPTARPRRCCSSPRATTPATSACSRYRRCRCGGRHGRRRTDRDGRRQSRKEATVDVRRRARLATRRGRRDATPSRAPSTASRSAYVVDGVGAAAARARARRRVRQGAGAVRQADRRRSKPSSTCAPTCCAPSSSAARPGYYACWAADDAARRRGPPRRDARHRVRERGLRAARRHRDPGVRRHRVHVGARHPPLLQATAHAVRRSRHHRRPPRRARHPRHRRLTTGSWRQGALWGVSRGRGGGSRRCCHRRRRRRRLRAASRSGGRRLRPTSGRRPRGGSRTRAGGPPTAGRRGC